MHRLRVDLISQVTLLGGVSDRATLVRLRSDAEVDAALRAGTLERDARGRYALATTRPAVRTANRVSGILSHRSAAQYWGWAQKTPPALPEVTFPRERHVDPALRRSLVPHWSVLQPRDVVGPVTSQERTLVDCMRNLPWDESLPIVDSAIRADDFVIEEVRAIAHATKGRGRARIEAVAAVATGKPYNPLESVLQAQARLVPGLNVTPQLPVDVPGGRTLHPDLGDRELRIALEAEGFEWHGDPAALTRDCRRYNMLALLGWQVIRFSWYLVMFEPAYVHQTLITAVEAAHQHANVA
jgi:very-short-patch-repair endonuclease